MRMGKTYTPISRTRLRYSAIRVGIEVQLSNFWEAHDAVVVRETPDQILKAKPENSN